MRASDAFSSPVHGGGGPPQAVEGADTAVALAPLHSLTA